MDRQPLIFELGKPGRRGVDLPKLDVPAQEGLIPAGYERQVAAVLPEVSQIELMRHYTQLSHKTFGVDEGFYPLGSCTMKYNPKINEVVARYVGLSAIHPYQEAATVQGALEVLYKMEEKLVRLN